MRGRPVDRVERVGAAHENEPIFSRFVRRALPSTARTHPPPPPGHSSDPQTAAPRDWSSTSRGHHWRITPAVLNRLQFHKLMQTGG